MADFVVRNDEVVGSIPTSSTNPFHNLAIGPGLRYPPLPLG